MSTSAPEFDTIIELERRRCQALGEVDLETLRSLTAADYTHIHADGRIENCEEYFAGLEASAPRETTRGELSVRHRGDVVILTGPFQVTIRREGAPPQEIVGIATGVWSRVDSSWEHVSFQVTPFPAVVQNAR